MYEIPRSRSHPKRKSTGVVIKVKSQEQSRQTASNQTIAQYCGLNPLCSIAA
jgi:hypothetical protein